MNEPQPPSRRPLRELFLEALDQPLAERSAFLDQACGGNADLRARLEWLLANYREDSFLEGGAAVRSDSAAAPVLAEEVGTVMGRYKLLETIGEGGFGSVWLAEQRESVRRRVALKILRYQAGRCPPRSPAICIKCILAQSVQVRQNFPMNVRFLPDNAIREPKQDAFDIGAFVQLIHESLQNTETPYVYGLLGDWGTGKTSALKLLRNAVTEDYGSGSRFIPIWFNPWLYENEVNMIYPMLHLLKKAYEESPYREQSRVAFAKSFTKIAIASTLGLADLGLRALTKHTTGESIGMREIRESFTLVEEHANSIEKVLANWTDSVTTLQQTFQSLVDQFARDYAFINHIDERSVKFLILIDDLDRCLPERVIVVLEGIKNFLSAKRCVYVFGLNPDVVYSGIKVKYQGAPVNGRAYLEKILNYCFYIPEPSVDALRAFATTQLSNLLVDEADSVGLKAHFQLFGETIAACQFSNPRRIKRILNRYILFLQRFAQDADRYNMNSVVRLLILAEYYPDIFHLYLKQRGGSALLRKLGTSEFSLERFERDTGLDLTAEYPSLARMSDLFALPDALPGDKRFDLAHHAEAVFSIARLR